MTPGFMPLKNLDKNYPYPRLMIATEGVPDSGKTEFMLSAPNNKDIILVDRNIDGVLTNPRPPEARQPLEGCSIQAITAPSPTQAKKEVYVEHYIRFRDATYASVNNPRTRVACIDGDSDSWELQRLAEWGNISNVSLAYTTVNAARRGFYSRLWDAHKIIIATNKLRDEWIPDRDEEGNIRLDEKGKEKRIKTGRLVAQGFDDENYLWQIRIRHLYDEKKRRWGLRIMRCKHDRDLVGTELWGGDCNFAGLVQTVYPDIDLAYWGF